MDQDIDIRQRMERLETISYKDSLTGLWNRNYLVENINEYLHDRRAGGTLFMVDLDNFKLVNDTYGHILGDELLKNIGNYLTESVREGDIVARLGGDEFVVFLKGNLDDASIEKRAMAIIEAVDKSIEKMGLECQVTASVGVASVSKKRRDFMSLYEEADKALYLVKRNGKNGYYLYSDAGRPEDYVFAKTNEKPDINVLKRFITERDKPKGAFNVEYDSFKRIYQFMSRYIGRAGNDARIVLFTLVDGKGRSAFSDTDVMFTLERIIKDSLRVGDVATNYSSSQFLVLLMDVGKDNALGVAKRVCDRFAEETKGLNFTLKYDTDTIK
ncbi:MAG: diguanylate cyclase [Lachnospiraceae bacterium]|nr:diguanylate cyclase [Lachnospiraceae bacterium]